MLYVNITSFRKNMYSLLEQTVKFNEPVNISTRNGNAVILSEKDYKGLMETISLCSIPEMRDILIGGRNPPLSAVTSEDRLMEKAVHKAIENQLQQGHPVARYDLALKKPYLEYPDGTIKYE